MSGRSGVVGRARGTFTIVRALAADRGTPYLPPERLWQLRDRRVRATVAHAAEHVPYYRDLFRSSGLDPASLRTAADLSTLPLLDKNTVHGALDRFRSRAFDDRELVALRTSGRSGAWLTVRHDRESLLAGIAYAERERAVEAHFTGRRYRYSVVEIRSEDSSVGHTQAAYRRTSFRPLRPETHLIPIETTPDRVVSELSRLRPDVVRTYGSYAEVLFRYLAANDVPLTPPSTLMYGGDAMSAAGRAFVEACR